MEIVPFESIGNLRFGEGRQVVRGRLGNGYTTFRKDVGESETDAYNDNGLHLYFDSEDRLEFVEAFGNASPSFQGIKFLGRAIDEVADKLSAIGHAAVLDDVGLQCDSAGIGVTAPRGTVEGVAVFRKGYYDE